MIDFRRSIPPHLPELHSYISTALQAIAASNDMGLMLRQSAARGTEGDRAAAAQFLRTRFDAELDPCQIILSNGTQNALLVLLQMLGGTNELVVAERLTYGSLAALARIANVRLEGLDIDDHGIIPESFATVCKARRPKVLYCNPTVQNPTAAVMPETRRLALIDMARRYGVTIIEDDALGRLHVDGPKPIAALAPDITWYVMSTTKCLAQGLRLAYVVAPRAAGAEKVIAPVEQLSYWHAAPLTAALVSLWITSGIADKITARIAGECVARERLARDILSNADVRSVPGSMHLWINLPARWDRHQFVAVAQRHGVLMRSSDHFAIDGHAVPNAVRLALSPPADLDEVRRGLLVLRDLLEDPASSSQRGAVYEVEHGR